MDVRQRGLQIFGWLAVMAGYGIALFLIRGVSIWIKRGLFAGRGLWVLIGHLLFLAFAVYYLHGGKACNTYRERRFKAKNAIRMGKNAAGEIADILRCK